MTAQAVQMPIAGDDQIRLTGQGAGNDMIVIGIVLNHARHRQRRNHKSQAPQIRDRALC